MPVLGRTLCRGLLVAALAASACGQQGTAARRVGDQLARRGAPSLADLWTPATARAVERGLTFLAKTQSAEGCWTGDVGHKRGNNYMVFRSAETQRTARAGHIGVTALAGMAFLSAGHLPDRGRHGKVVAATLDYLLAHLGDSGLMTDSGTRMYSHAFATLFLAEVCGMKHDRRVRTGLERAVHLIVDCQNEHGGWRYNPFSRDADLSVTVCQLQALRAARNIGLRVPPRTIERAVAYVRASQTRRGRAKGLFYYKIHGRGAYQKNTQFSINAAALTALISAGVYEQELMSPALGFLAEEAVAVQDYSPQHFYYWYGNYYACQALFHGDGLLPGTAFRDYYVRTRTHLLAQQRDDGRWENDVGPGDTFATAVACVVLQVPTQLLPIFQR